MMLGKYDAKLDPGDAGLNFVMHIVRLQPSSVSAWSVSDICHHAMLSDFAFVCIGLWPPEPGGVLGNERCDVVICAPSGYYELHTGLTEYVIGMI